MSPTQPRPIARGALRGFSLIEILVVITLIGLLMTFGFNAMRGAMEKGRVTKCQKNLQEIGQSMIAFRDMRNKRRWPDESGIRFLLTLYRKKEIVGRGAEVFLCPGRPDVRNDTGPSGEIGSSYDDWESIDSMTIAYAGRDMESCPIRGTRDEDEVIASDDNELGPNHRTVTNILYANGEVVPYDLQIDGTDILAEYPEYDELGLPVGPDSPYEPLQVLRVD
jgi:prepilin-type N-terminal cleavage/methylation domain-containing protein